MTNAALVNIQVDAALDITRDRCPMTYVRVRLALDRLSPGQVLQVTLRGDEPLRNVPRSAEQQGHRLIHRAAEPGGISRLWIEKSARPAG